VDHVESFEALTAKAWEAALGGRPFDPNGTWGDTGADSIMTLNLTFELETRLKRKVSFEWIEPATTIRGLAERLALGAPAAEAKGPLIFLIPGVYGDEPILADFRRWFAGALRFDVIDLPGPETPAAVLGCMGLMGRQIAEDINARAPDGELILAGYSLGGGVAYEAAAALTGMGRRIQLLIVLDTFLADAGPTAKAEPAASPTAPALVKDLIALEWDQGRKILSRVAGLFDPKTSRRVRRWLVRRFRLKALVTWRPKRLDAPILLAVSAESEPVILPRWTALAPHLSLIRIDGGHTDLFAAAAMTHLGPSVLKAVGAQGA
jgi:thioesterase domain-containing protein